MGVAHNSNYLIWFEMGRTEFSHAVGYPYSKIEEQGLAMVVAESLVRYKRPCHYEDKLIVRSRLTDVKKRTAKFEYEIIDSKSGRLMAEGHTVHVIVDKKSGRPTSMPPEPLAVFSSAVAGT
jgi:acyl-CoA thioester hydrolase